MEESFMNKMKYKFDWKATTTKIKKKEEEKKKTGFPKDERFYYPEFKPDGKAEAIIRFLPMKLGKDGRPMYELPYVELYSHSFKETGRNFFSNCPKTIGNPCPVCEDVVALYADGDKTTGGRRYKKVEYVVNILVVKDPLHPENNGKVFLHRFKKKIKEKLWAKWMPPEDSVDDPVDIWDYDEGCNFALKITRTAKDENGESHVDYSTSEFKAPSAVPEEELERINEQMYDLNEFLDPKRFKSYDDLNEKYKKVIGTAEGSLSSGSEKKFSNKNSSSKVDEEENIESTSVVVDEEEIESNDDFFNQLRNDSDED